MIIKFWEKVGEGVAGEWLARALTPALMFWGVGLLGLVYQKGGWQAFQQFITVNESQGIAWILAALFIFNNLFRHRKVDFPCSLIYSGRILAMEILQV